LQGISALDRASTYRRSIARQAIRSDLRRPPDYIELLPRRKALADKVVRALVEELIFDIPNSVNANSLQQNLSVLGGQFQNTFSVFRRRRRL
jgi:hypothetical protein